MRPGLLLAMVWGVVFGLTMYGPDVVQDAADKSEALQKQDGLRALLDGVAAIGQAVGLPSLRQGLGRLREKVNASYTVLVYEEPEGPAEPVPPVVAPPPAAADVHAPTHLYPLSPRRVLVIGASSIQFAIGVELERRMPTYQGVKVKRFGRLATGLSRPDFFDWPAKFEALATAFKPDLVIANFGGNGAQAIRVDGEKVEYPGRPWDEAYAAKVREMVNIAQAHGAQIVFMGMPVMRSAQFSAKMRDINRVQARVCAQTGALFIPTYDMAAMPDGSYRSSLKYRGKRGLMRTSDGVHYSKLGAAFVVEQVLQQVERRYRLTPSEPELARAEGHAFVSRVNSSTVAYVAYLPRAASPEARKPALLVLPDAADDWGTWPNFPHRALQAAAEAQGLAVIVLRDPQGPDWLQGVDPFGQDALQGSVMGELLDDVKLHLPISDVVGLSGAGPGATTLVALSQRQPQRFQSLSLFGAVEAPAPAPGGPVVRPSPGTGVYAEALPEIIAWHAKPRAP